MNKHGEHRMPYGWQGDEGPSLDATQNHYAHILYYIAYVSFMGVEPILDAFTT